MAPVIATVEAFGHGPNNCFRREKDAAALGMLLFVHGARHAKVVLKL